MYSSVLCSLPVVVLVQLTLPVDTIITQFHVIIIVNVYIKLPTLNTELFVQCRLPRLLKITK